MESVSITESRKEDKMKARWIRGENVMHLCKGETGDYGYMIGMCGTGFAIMENPFSAKEVPVCKKCLKLCSKSCDECAGDGICEQSRK
jgi:hypothetical protein